MTSSRLLAGLFLALLLWPPVQDGNLTMTAHAGFDGLYEDSKPVPVVISARNDGPAIEGEFRVLTTGGPGSDSLVFTAPVSLPTGSDKRVALVVHTRPFESPLTVQLVSDDQVITEVQTNRLNYVSPDTLLYGVVSSDPGGLAFLETVEGGRADAAVAFLNLVDLPEVSSAWNALDILVLDDVDTSRLSAGQSASLLAWIESGGQLVVTGGPGGPQTASGVADLLPVSVTGTGSMPDLPALSESGGQPFNAPGPYVVTRSELRQGDLLINQDGLPLLAHRALGRGGVYFLALDPKLAPLAGWSGGDRLWQTIAAGAATLPPWAEGVRDSYAATQAVAYIPGLRLPAIWQLFLFLLIYTLIIGPVNFLVLRRMNRRELAWVTIPALVLLFSAVTFFTGFRARGNTATLNVMSIAFGSVESDRLRTQSVVGLYSPRRAVYDLTLPYDSTAFSFDQSIGLTATTGNLDSIHRASDVTLRGVRTDTSEVATFLVESYQSRPPVSAEAVLSAEGDRVEVTVRNSAGETLEDAVLLYGERMMGVGDLAPGEEKTVQLSLAGAPAATTPLPAPLFPSAVTIPNPLMNDPSLLLGTTEFFNDPVAFPRWQLIQSTYNYEGTAPVALPDPTATVTLAGWLPAVAGQISVTGGQTTQIGTTLLLLEIPVG